MLSTRTIISIFTEIFSAGILFAGAYNFFSRFLRQKTNRDIHLGAVFLIFAGSVSLTVASQMMYNLGRPISELIMVHKLIYFNIALCSLFLWFFIVEKFGSFRSLSAKAISFALIGIVAAAAIGILLARFDLVYRADVIEPVINHSLPIPSKPLWLLMWAAFSGLCLFRAFSSHAPKRNLLFLSAFSSALILAAYFCAEIYINTAEASLLLASWVLTLFGVTGLLVGEIIPADSRLALEPLNLFRTRILYKLLLIFVLLTSVLLQVTTIVTINISREPLIASIKEHQKAVAQNIAEKIEYAGLTGGKPDMGFIRNLAAKTTTENRLVYIVDRNMRVIAHPQELRVGLDVSGVIPAEKLLKGKSGSLEYLSPMFEIPYKEVVGSFSRVGGSSLGVIIEEPKAYAYVEIRRVETNSLIFVITGIILTILIGVFFARTIESPIRDVIAGTEAVRKGNLSYRINVDSVDEIGQLASAFNQMTTELRDTQEHLVSSEKLAALGTMAAGMAHEIKNPLVALRTFTQLLQQKFDDADFRKKFASIVPQEIERINKIAESLLKFGRPTKPELGKVNVNKILEEVMELLENECRRADIRITTKFADFPEITGDAMQLSQAFVNIVLNAIQAMQKGGELTVKTDVGEVIRLSKTMRKGVLKKDESSFSEGVLGERDDASQEMAEKAVPVVFIEITDTGSGIPEESLRTVFDPFYTTKVGGTGMGLPITLRIIEDHKGSIKVKSQPAKGTTFIVTLPQRMEEV